MSYILDALKKSEQERGKGNIPGVQTVHSSSLMYRKETKRLWPYGLAAAVLLNLIAIGYFFYRYNPNTPHTPPVTSSPAVPVAPAPPQTADTLPAAAPVTTTPKPLPAAVTKPVATAVAPPRNTSSPAVGSPANPPRPAEEPANVKQASLSPPHRESIAQAAAAPVEKTQSHDAETDFATDTTVYAEDLPEQFELPEDVQRTLPTITISAHVYSSKPQQRSMVINNQFLEEGDYVIDGLVLEEITRDGAIFNYNGLRFHNGVVSGWQ